MMLATAQRAQRCSARLLLLPTMHRVSAGVPDAQYRSLLTCRAASALMLAPRKQQRSSPPRRRLQSSHTVPLLLKPLRSPSCTR